MIVVSPGGVTVEHGNLSVHSQANGILIISLASHFHQPFTQAPNRQLVWERNYLKQAGLEPNVPGCVIFWLGLESISDLHPGPEPYAMDTRREIGKFTAYAETMPVRMVVGDDPAFHGLDVIMFELREIFGQRFRF